MAIKPINHSTILKNALTKTGHQRTLGIIAAWKCWCEMLAFACEDIRTQEQQAIERWSLSHWIEYCGNPMKPEFYADGQRILDLLAAEALSRNISAAPFLEAKKFLNGVVRLSERQCNFPIEEQDQIAISLVGKCQAEIESAIMLLSAEPDKTGWLTITQAATVANADKGVIGAAASDGRIKDNGKTGRERRIDPISLNAWSLKRADRPKEESIPEIEQRIAEARKAKEAKLTPREQNREAMRDRLNAGTL